MSARGSDRASNLNFYASDKSVSMVGRDVNDFKKMPNKVWGSSSVSLS